MRDQADRAISKAQLHALLRFHMPPIDVVVYHGSRARPGFEGGFPLRCFQRLSRPHIATRLCRWRSEEHTSELQSLMRISYAVFCLNKKTKHYTHKLYITQHN